MPGRCIAHLGTMQCTIALDNAACEGSQVWPIPTLHFDMQALQGTAIAELRLALSGYPLEYLPPIQAYPVGTGFPGLNMSALPAHCQHVGVSCCGQLDNSTSPPYYVSGSRASSSWVCTPMCAGCSTIDNVPCPAAMIAALQCLHWWQARCGLCHCRHACSS